MKDQMIISKSFLIKILLEFNWFYSVSKLEKGEISEMLQGHVEFIGKDDQTE